MDTAILLTATGAAALAIGFAAGWLAAASGKNAAKAEAARLSAAIESEREKSEALVRAEREAARHTVDEIRRANSEIAAERERAHAAALQEMDRRFTEIVGRSTARIQNAADSMLRESQREFATRSGNDIGNIVNPLKESIEKMRMAMEGNTLRQTEIGANMRSAMAEIMEANRLTRESADNLARVFKSGSKVQGDWGEAVLDELLRSQGFTPGVHYDIQTSLRDANGIAIKSESGALMRPDVILHLDTTRDVIIDSKVSMTAYLDYVNAASETERSAALRSHVESVETHVRELAAKDYTSYIRAPKSSIGYMIMFVPNSGALWLAINSKPDLWRRAMERNVFIADEQTLFAALKIIRMTWTQIAQAQNHEKVYSLANEMLDRAGMFVKRLNAVGEAIRNAQEAYDQTCAKLWSGRQSISATCAKLIKLGARQSQRNPIPGIEEAPAEEEGIGSLPQ